MKYKLKIKKYLSTNKKSSYMELVKFILENKINTKKIPKNTKKTK